MKLQFLLCFFSIISFLSCSDNQQTNPKPGSQTVSTLYQNKPGSTYPDTLKINTVAAVFYSPDSLQLQKIRSVADPAVFDSRMHEYEYLTKTANSVIKTGFSHVQVIEAKNVRYLVFITADNKESYVDLDMNYDPYGLYIFDRQKAPQLVDMSNAETELGFYFSR